MQNGTLRIQRVERGSSGIYTCHASSIEGSATHTTQLLVLGALWEGGGGLGTGTPSMRTDLWLGAHMAGVGRRPVPEGRGCGE